ncbi:MULTISPECIES: hypothetical protein [unclassified Lactobacillus]|uniref:hypothetical protein n=1 Tax=unclassified Lactobacillus TaxID=2620435 RepID=UPI00226A9DCF|nr:MULTISPECIES: hypothetical protein [unclassified Lactobacillus]MCX8722088.1 hypothetical protein [Lactobacillus sp. B4010]MCX8723852.1 hypothetical protein [Lactobacillus sp. B4005]MCX8732726.1 hypothetical protein [Lactobacillus sp. B4015]MCX8734946.1 hypothetical protein [Lactobacillus sp. B4012]
MKQLKRVNSRLMLIGLVIMLIGLAGAINLLLRNPAKTMELPNEYLNLSFVSLYLQPVILILFYNHVLTFHRIRLLVGVRQKTNLMILKLLGLGTIYCTLFLVALFVPYFFSDHPLFKYGNPLLGTALIVLHIAVLLFLFWLLVGAYNSRYPYLFLILVIILDLVYHYYIEKKLLINYSPMYDEVYRIIHHIQGGF